MTLAQIQRVRAMDAECSKLDKKIQSAKRRYECALFDLIQAEREHAAAIQRRTAYEGKYVDSWPNH